MIYPGWAAALLAAACMSCGRSPIPPSPDAPRPQAAGGRLSPELAAELHSLEAREQKINETIWAKEQLAQECGHAIEDFWDALNAATNKLALVADAPVETVQLGSWTVSQSLPHGILAHASQAGGASLNREQWRVWVSEQARAGWVLVATEFRHDQFDVDAVGAPAQSQFYFSAHLTNATPPLRATVEGDLTVRWGPRAPGQPAAIREIDASRLGVRTRAGNAPFQLILDEHVTPIRNSRSIDPLIVYDLDRDGRPEIILTANNRIYRSRERGPYRAETLFKGTPDVIYAAVVADFDGDGLPDLLANTLQGLTLFKGRPEATFAQPGTLAWRSPPDLKYVMALTCGDIDQDGDLDLFVAQYKLPYEEGQMPTPYYDANDGYPAYLLRNDGRGQFTDGTESSGLRDHRRRRSYSCSFTDLDNDGRLDLVVVSDFAGIDLYRGDGKGHFQEVTHAWVPESHAFGMGHALADFNADGVLDVLMTGMPSPTGNRLEHLGLWRTAGSDERDMRARMIAGNRLYVGKSGGGFEMPRANASIARSGWSWGCTASDLDNDGYPDVYVANGMESRASVRDYEGEFWLHDLYVANSSENPAAYLYLQGKVTASRGRGESYGGYEKNRLYLNQGGASFLEAAHLMGVAIEADSRNVVANDLEGDGRVDLLVTSFEPWPNPKQRLRVYQNTLAEIGHWIGFRFEDTPAEQVCGTQVTVRWAGRSAVRPLVTGDSHRSQHANALHFGLGATTSVDEVEIRWPSGRATRLERPMIDCYHTVSP